MASSQDAWYLSLLGLAENFRRANPPQIKCCIQCLQAVFTFSPPVRVEARTHLQLGNILLNHTKNIDIARHHLEQAWSISQTINAFDEVKFETASVLADLYDQQSLSHLAKPILRKAIELSQHSIYWHCRLIFQLAQIHATERNYEVASSLLGVGVDYAHISAANYTRILFLLSQCMLLLAEKKLAEVSSHLVSTGKLIEGYQGNQYQKEYLRIFFLVLQVCWYLAAGQVKSVEPLLKQLQQSIQNVIGPMGPTDEMVCGPNVGDAFLWMPKTHLKVVVYLITVMHSMQAGYMDRAHKNATKVFSEIERLKNEKPSFATFQLQLLEHMVMCQLVMGEKAEALNEIAQAVQLCQPNQRLRMLHKPQLHTLLGLYAMSMNCMEAAEAQFSAVLTLSKDRDLWTFANLNLAIMYLRGRQDQQFNILAARISPEVLKKQGTKISLQAAAYYVQGLQAFFQGQHNEAKRYLREMLSLANAEGLNRLTSCSLVLLGQIYLSLENSNDSMNMVKPAMHLASKIPDLHIQLWASAILKDLYRMCHDPVQENEAQTMHTKYSQVLLEDHFTASGMPEHNLINWIDDSFPMHHPPAPAPL